VAAFVSAYYAAFHNAATMGWNAQMRFLQEYFGEAEQVQMPLSDAQATAILEAAGYSPTSSLAAPAPAQIDPPPAI
jgi:hypothetical protein